MNALVSANRELGGTRDTALLTGSQEELLNHIERGPVALDEVSTRIGDIRALIEIGFIELKVVAYEWGLDWYLVAHGAR